MSIINMWRYTFYWIIGNAILYLIARESFPLHEWFNLIAFVSCLTFLTFLEPKYLPEPPTQEELEAYAKLNIKTAKVQRRLPRKPDGVHQEVSK